MRHGILLGVLLCGLVSFNTANAQVYIAPKKPEQASNQQPANKPVYVVPNAQTPNKQTVYPNRAGITQPPKLGQAMTAEQYNASLLKKQQDKIQQDQQQKLYNPPVATPVVPNISTPGIVANDGKTYFDPATGMFMQKSAFAQQLWARGEDPNALYPNAFPQPPAPAKPVQGSGLTSGWNNQMPR